MKNNNDFYNEKKSLEIDLISSKLSNNLNLNSLKNENEIKTFFIKGALICETKTLLGHKYHVKYLDSKGLTQNISLISENKLDLEGLTNIKNKFYFVFEVFSQESGLGQYVFKIKNYRIVAWEKFKTLLISEYDIINKLGFEKFNINKVFLNDDCYKVLKHQLHYLYNNKYYNISNISEIKNLFMNDVYLIIEGNLKRTTNIIF